MHIRYGYSIDIEQSDDIAIETILDIHLSQRGDITQPETVVATALSGGQQVDATFVEKDHNGNLVRRFLAPAGGLRIETEGVVFHSGFAESGRPSGGLPAAASLPPEVLPFLLPSRCCPEGEVSDRAWSLFRHVGEGWDQVLAICDYVNRKLHPFSSPTASQTAGQALDAGAGSMDDFAHLAIAFCRSLGIPARYCRGYLLGPEGGANLCEHSFCAWFEVYLDGDWWTADARHLDARIGRILVAQAADAAAAPVALGGKDLQVTRLDCFAEPVEGARFPATSRERHAHWQMLNDRTG